MRLLLNIIWLIFGGLVLALAYAIVGVICCITIIGIPFGIASFRIALFTLWPFGKKIQRHPAHGVASTIGNIFWVIFFGWWLALGHLFSGVAMCITIIGIPLGLANFKLIPVSLTPLGREIVDVDAGDTVGAFVI